MRYRIPLLTLLLAGLLAGSLPALAGIAYPTYNLQRTEIRGTVESVNDQEAYVLTDDGSEVGVQLGPRSYWEDRGYYLNEGDDVEMEVWYDPDGYTDWYFAGEIWGDGFHYVLTNNYGVPFWVISAQDYYYIRGYRASCVSFMVWYDCPPVYFLWLSLPPPPPRYYGCYYGPRWQHHYHDWYWGSRYGRGGSYWRDGDGYQRPGRREYTGGPRGDDNDPRWNGGPRGRQVPTTVPPVKPMTPPPSTDPVSPTPRVKSPRGDDRWQKQTTPRVKAPSSRNDQWQRPPNSRGQIQPRKDQWQKRPDPQSRKESIYQRPDPAPRNEPRYRERRVTTPPNERKYQPRASAPAPDRRAVTPRSEPRERRWQGQPPAKPQTQTVKPEARRQEAPRGQSNREYRQPQNNQPQQRGNSSDGSRGSRGSRGNNGRSSRR